MAGKLRPRCFFDVELGGKPVGRLVFELFNETTPRTCENFRALCTGERGVSTTSSRTLHYKGAPFHRIVKGFMIQGGDFINGNGTGGESIYGGTFADENFIMKHDQNMVLSMANRGKDTNGSQFFIITQPTPHLDGVHVVFGRLLSGTEIVREIEKHPVDEKSRPKVEVVIANCGELVPQVRLKAKAKKNKKKQSDESEDSASEDESDSDSDTDSETDKKRKKKKQKKDKKKKKEKKKKKKESSLESGEERSDPEDKPEFFSTVRPEEIPVIPTNRFLSRGGPEPEDGTKETADSTQLETQWQTRSKRQFTSSGRKLKGRGTIRYRSASRSRSRSLTPPHWRREQARVQPLSASIKPQDAQEPRWLKGDRLQEKPGSRLAGRLGRGREPEKEPRLQDRFQQSHQRSDGESEDEDQTSSKKKKVPTATLR